MERRSLPSILTSVKPSPDVLGELEHDIWLQD
jgi:hypothetical protein